MAEATADGEDKSRDEDEDGAGEDEAADEDNEDEADEDDDEADADEATADEATGATDAYAGSPRSWRCLRSQRPPGRVTPLVKGGAPSGIGWKLRRSASSAVSAV